MKFSELIVTDQFKVVNSVSGQVRNDCPVYQKTTPFKFTPKKWVNAAYQKAPNKPASYVFFEDDTDVVRI